MRNSQAPDTSDSDTVTVFTQDFLVYSTPVYNEIVLTMSHFTGVPNILIFNNNIISTQKGLHTYSN